MVENVVAPVVNTHATLHAEATTWLHMQKDEQGNVATTWMTVSAACIRPPTLN
jgi:hypothetical protein